MKEWLILVTEHAIVLIDAMSLAVIVIGTIEAVVGGVRLMAYGSSEHQKRELWLRYARWLVAGLTFQLAADIIETSVSTSWEVLGRIAAVAVIRTFLNYFGDTASNRRLGFSVPVPSRLGQPCHEQP